MTRCTLEEARIVTRWLRDAQADAYAARAAAEADMGAHVPGSTERVFRAPLEVACALAAMGRKR